MNVKLIGKTMNIWNDSVHGASEICGIAAATCYNGDTPEKSLRVSLASGHDSVSEHASFTFQIEGVSRVLLAQLTRHRIASFSVESQRYVPFDNGIPMVIPKSILDSDPNYGLVSQWEDIKQRVEVFYSIAQKAGVPIEDARYAIPQGVETNLVLTMNARELRHFFSLRCCNRAQWEIRELADKMLKICKMTEPKLFENCGADCENGRGCQEKRPCGHPRSKEK